LTNNIESGN